MISIHPDVWSCLTIFDQTSSFFTIPPSFFIIFPRYFVLFTSFQVLQFFFAQIWGEAQLAQENSAGGSIEAAHFYEELETKTVPGSIIFYHDTYIEICRYLRCMNSVVTTCYNVENFWDLLKLLSVYADDLGHQIPPIVCSRYYPLWTPNSKNPRPTNQGFVVSLCFVWRWNYHLMGSSYCLEPKHFASYQQYSHMFYISCSFLFASGWMGAASSETVASVAQDVAGKTLIDIMILWDIVSVFFSFFQCFK